MEGSGRAQVLTLLPAELFLLILSQLSVPAVLSVRASCRSLRKVTADKELWLGLTTVWHAALHGVDMSERHSVRSEKPVLPAVLSCASIVDVCARLVRLPTSMAAPAISESAPSTSAYAPPCVMPKRHHCAVAFTMEPTQRGAVCLRADAPFPAIAAGSGPLPFASDAVNIR